MSSNLVVVFGIIVFYVFLLWGVDSLYNVDSDIIIPSTVLGEVSTLSMFERVSDFAIMIFEISTFTDDRIPDLIMVLIITPLNFLLFGSIVYLIRGGGT